MGKNGKGFDWSDPKISKYGSNTTPEERDHYEKNQPSGGQLSTLFIILCIVVFLLNLFSCGR